MTKVCIQHDNWPLSINRADHKSRSREIRVYTFPITPKFDRHLGNSAAKMPVEFLSDTLIITSNLVALDLGLLTDAKMHFNVITVLSVSMFCLFFVFRLVVSVFKVSCDIFIHIIQCCFIATGKCQWNNVCLEFPQWQSHIEDWRILGKVVFTEKCWTLLLIYKKLNNSKRFVCLFFFTSYHNL